MSPSQEWAQRIFAALFVLAIEYVGGYVMPLVPRDGIYYIAATCFNAFMFFYIGRFFRPTLMIRNVQLLLMAQAIIQLMGLALYSLDEEPYFYNAAIYIIVRITFICIFWGSPTNDDGYTITMRSAT